MFKTHILKTPDFALNLCISIESQKSKIYTLKVFILPISVIGLNFDFLSLNLIGFTLYGCFNVALFWVDSIQARSCLGNDDISFKSNVTTKTQNSNWVLFCSQMISNVLIRVKKCFEQKQSNHITTENDPGQPFGMCGLQAEYYTKHPRGVLPVTPPDVFFPIHAVFATSITIFQVSQKTSRKNLLKRMSSL